MTQRNALDFEKPIVDIEKKIEEMKHFTPDGGVDHNAEIKKLHRKVNKLKQEIYSKLSPWEITQVARHPERPYTIDYIEAVFDDFVELHGDRNFGDDRAIVGGLARLDGTPVVVIGTQKGRTTKEKIFRNFGMPNPEGYRKCLRLMDMAERFKRPIITLIDTPGAYPGVGAEERGQAEAIAKNLQVMSKLKTPIVSVVIGEGGSGGALALALADTVMMLELSTYSVISPEGCAAILWKDRAKAEAAAKQLKITASDLLGMGLIDAVIPEPLGGAHRNPDEAAEKLKASLVEAMEMLIEVPLNILLEARYNKFRNMGAFITPEEE
jgi:acetyl-CoA carboxylase carboxyl transferase subunit alpha